MNRTGRFKEINVERYLTHAVIGYRFRANAKHLFGIELDGEEHTWPTPALQQAACDQLGIPRSESHRVKVIDFQ